MKYYTIFLAIKTILNRIIKLLKLRMEMSAFVKQVEAFEFEMNMSIKLKFDIQTNGEISLFKLIGLVESL